MIAKMSEISKTANIPRQDVYRVMAQLMQLGLVEKTITTPVEYKGIALKEVFFNFDEKKK
jgi:sugar-specific transcriptional regulator TrmB